MSILEIVIRVIAAVVVLCILFPALYRLFGAEEAYAVRRLEAYFRQKVYPRYELAQQWQKVVLAEHLIPTWRESRKQASQIRKGNRNAENHSTVGTWKEQEEEIQCGYYLRTGQTMADMTKDVPVERWYGIDAWIRDILASRVNYNELCSVSRK